MPYRLFDLDVTQPMPDFVPAPDDDGMAVLVRRRGRPIAFWIEAIQLGIAPTASKVISRMAREAAHAALRDGLRAELPLQRTDAMPSLTVAICTRDRPAQLARCLEALDDVTIPPELSSPQILVVDNAPSGDSTRAATTGHPRVHYVVEPVPGLNFARNRALKESQGEWIAFLDDDVVPDRAWLSGIEDVWRSHPDAKAITGLVLPLALDTEAQILFERAGGFRRGCETIRYENRLPNNRLYPCGSGIFGAGANMAFHAETIRALGGFDPALDTGPPLSGGGDLDMFYRVIRSGHVLVYEPAALVFHEHRAGLDALTRQYYTWGLGFMTYVSKHLGEDREMRGRFLGLIKWWFGFQFKNVLNSLRRKHPLPIRMLLAELRGGFVGLAGEYDRSRRRVARRRSRFADVPVECLVLNPD